MTSVFNNKRTREIFQPNTDHDSETMTNNIPGTEVLSNSRKSGNWRYSVDDERNALDVEYEMSSNSTKCNSKERTTNNYMFPNQQIRNGVPSNNPSKITSSVDNHKQLSASISDQKSLHNVEHRMEQSYCDLLHKRAKHKSDTEDCSPHHDRAEYGQKNTLKSEVPLERHNVDIQCPAFSNIGTVTVSNCGTPRPLSSYLGSGNLGVDTDFPPSIEENLLVQEKSGFNDIQHNTFSREMDYRTINDNETKVTQDDTTSLPEYLKTLAGGRTVCGDTYLKFSKPDWFDKEKFQRGQRFAINHIFSIMFAEVISLMTLFGVRGALDAMIFTGKSDTPFKAFKRYLSTVTRVKSWYEGDIWDVKSEAHKNLKAVRGMHEAVRKSIEATPEHELAKRVTLEGDGSAHPPLWTDLYEDIRDDFRSSCPFAGYLVTRSNMVCISQSAMGMAQFGFMGLILVFPKKFGVHFATEEDFEGFSHFWRTIGHLLGMDERYNLCNGDLLTVRQRCVDIIDHGVKPELRDVSRDWIHMSRCVFKGVSFYVLHVKFEVMLMYLCNVLDIQMNKLAASLTLWQKFQYHLIEYLYRFAFRFLPLLRMCNWIANMQVKNALHYGPKYLMKLEQINHPYDTS